MKRTKTKHNILSCPTCGSKTIMVECREPRLETWNRFRLHCSKDDFYGAWRKTQQGAINAWDKGLKSDKNSIGEEV